MNRLPCSSATLLSYSCPASRLTRSHRPSTPSWICFRSQPQCRTFFNPASLLTSTLPTAVRHLTHTRTIPYSPANIFDAIASVEKYHTFLPFVISSTVTQRDAAGWPRKATLKSGYDKFGVEEDWESVVQCDKTSGVIEAKSYDGDSSNDDSMFEILRTRWQITPSETGVGPDGSDVKSEYRASTPQRISANVENTSVRLDIEVKFRNIIYDQMFAQVEGKVASMMIGAFEKRAQELESKGYQTTR